MIKQFTLPDMDWTNFSCCLRPELRTDNDDSKFTFPSNCIGVDSWSGILTLLGVLGGGGASDRFPISDGRRSITSGVRVHPSNHFSELVVGFQVILVLGKMSS